MVGTKVQQLAYKAVISVSPLLGCRLVFVDILSRPDTKGNFE